MAEKGSIASDLSSLLESPYGADITLVVDNVELPAHSQILAARSPVFASMLRDDMKESRSRRLEISDMREAVLRPLLCFIYTDTVPELQSLAAELLTVADKYDLPLLKKKCEEKMMQDVNVENAATTAALAILHRCLRLKDAAVQFIARHPKVLATGAWARMLRENADTAVQICQQLATELPCPTCTDASESRNHVTVQTLDGWNIKPKVTGSFPFGPQ